jgi:mRNA interferase RelE/StbE
LENYKIFFRKSVFKELKILDKKTNQKIIRSIKSLAINPRPINSKKIKYREEIFRVRVGDYRILYEINDSLKQIIVASVLHRKEAYR